MSLKMLALILAAASMFVVSGHADTFTFAPMIDGKAFASYTFETPDQPDFSTTTFPLNYAAYYLGDYTVFF